MPLILLYFPRGLLCCCILKHGKISGGFSGSNFSPLPAIFSKIAKNTCGLNGLNFPPAPAILLYFATWQNKWWLQWLKFSPVAYYLILFSSMEISVGFNDLDYPPVPALWYFKHRPKTGDFNDLKFPPWPAIWLYFKHGEISGGFND